MKFYNKWAPFGSRNQNQNFNCQNKTLYNNHIPGHDSEVINVKWAKDRYLPLDGSVAMNGNLNLNNKQIINLGHNLQNSEDAINLGFADIKYFQKTAVEKFNMNNYTIDNLPDPKSLRQATSIKYVDEQINKNIHAQMKPSHKTNRLSCLMQNTLEWSDLIPGGNSFNRVKIADLPPDKGNFHSDNHKVIYTSMIKNSQGSYKYKMGIQCFPLTRNTDYTLCIEFLNVDCQLWHKPKISIDKATSKGWTISNVFVKTKSVIDMLIQEQC